MKYNVVIGYDRNVRIPAYVVAESIMEYASVPISFTFLHRNMLGNLARPLGEHDSTEFSNTRFLTPYLNNYEGWSLFLDNDIVVQHDIKTLFDYADEKYAVLCVKHDYSPKSNKKFLNKTQHSYKYKNWSSVMLFNNKLCSQLTLDYVQNAPGLDMHQFKWLESKDLIGTLPYEWNYLVGSDLVMDNPKIIHYTEGGPFYEKTKNCQYSDEWFNFYRKMIKIGQ